MFLAAIGLPLSTMTAAKTPAVKTESIVLGGGCFWCTDAAYKLLPGVVHVTAGYAGGSTINPTYEEVCSETTGHAEVVKVDFDPTVVTLKSVINYFWSIHNPTQVGGQGNDMGESYRSIILYANPEQKEVAEASLAEAKKVFRDPITTEIVPLKKFWPAEDYHQDYFAKNPHAGYCAYVIAPKVKHLKEEFPQLKQN